MGILRLVAVGVVVAAVVGCSAHAPEAVGGTAAPAGGASSSPTARGTAPPASAGKDGPLSAAMLRPTDVGRTYRLVSEPQGGDWSLHAVLPLCGYDDAPERPAEIESAVVELSVPGEDHLWVLERISREASGVGPVVMKDLHTTLDECQEFDTGDDRTVLTIVNAAFAGADSLLVELRRGSGEAPRLFAYVRQGDLVAELGFSQGTPRDDGRAIAVRAWQRLCAATPSC